jgi:hypothetical protein
MGTLFPTRQARLDQRHFERAYQASIGFLERNFDFVVMVCTSHGTSLSPERFTEHLGEYVVGVRGKSVWISLSRPEPVKVLALFWVTHGLIGLLYLFELLRVTAFVWVVFTGKFAIGFFDLLL